MTTIALVRAVSPAIARCELTHLARAPIDAERAAAQHAIYVAELEALGDRIERLADEPELPDAVFVEDTAVVLDEMAIITRPGAESRRAETVSVAAALSRYRRLRSIEAPDTLDGGDVLQVGRTLFVGITARTSAGGIAQLAAYVAAAGYDVATVPVTGCLHLKSAVTEIADRTLLINRAWVPTEAFAGLRLVAVDPSEPFAANAVRVGEVVVYPAEFPRTRARMEADGIVVRTVPASELAKAEGGVTCCSLRFTVPRM